MLYLPDRWSPILTFHAICELLTLVGRWQGLATLQRTIEIGNNPRRYVSQAFQVGGVRQCGVGRANTGHCVGCRRELLIQFAETIGQVCGELVHHTQFVNRQCSDVSTPSSFQIQETKKGGHLAACALWCRFTRPARSKAIGLTRELVVPCLVGHAFDQLGNSLRHFLTASADCLNWRRNAGQQIAENQCLKQHDRMP